VTTATTATGAAVDFAWTARDVRGRRIHGRERASGE
jgi:hypothetical protein